jgi:hypothetical protein
MDFECCFCRLRVEPQDLQLEVRVLKSDSGDDEPTQYLYCHRTCLRQAVDRDVPLLPEGEES